MSFGSNIDVFTEDSKEFINIDSSGNSDTACPDDDDASALRPLTARKSVPKELPRYKKPTPRKRCASVHSKATPISKERRLSTHSRSALGFHSSHFSGEKCATKMHNDKYQIWCTVFSSPPAPSASVPPHLPPKKIVLVLTTTVVAFERRRKGRHMHGLLLRPPGPGEQFWLEYSQADFLKNWESIGYCLGWH